MMKRILMIRIGRLGLLLGVIGALLIVAPVHAAKRYALLVGVSEYRNADLSSLRNLAGAVNDVRAMAQILKKDWGFDVVTTLTDAEATQVAVLNALDTLVQTSAPGDQVLFYFSGHGTSPNDPGSGLPLPHTTGALYVHDSLIKASPPDIVKSLIVGRRDLRPRFAALDQKGVYLTVLIDACFSENITRNLRGPSRTVRLPAMNFGDFGAGSVAYEPYPYQRVVTLAASAANQTAMDIGAGEINRYPTFDGKFHGAFSDAVLRALRDRALPDYGSLDKNADGTTTIDELFIGVRSFMQQRNYDHSPKLQVVEVSGNARDQALFYQEGDNRRPGPSAAPASSRPTPLRIRFAGSDDERRLLATVPAIEWVAEKADLQVSRQGSVYRLEDAAGLQIGQADHIDLLKEHLRRRALLEQAVSNARLSGKATIGLELNAEGVTNRLPLDTKEQSVRVPLVLKGNQPGHPLVLDLFGDGAVRRLYPYRSGEERPWPSGQINQVMCVKTTPPAGVDTIYVFWLSQPLPAHLLASNAVTIAPGDGGRFDALLSELHETGRVLGADRLLLEIYEPQPEELAAWPPRCR